MSAKEIKRNDRFIQYGLIAAHMAVQDAGLNNLTPEEKLSIGVTVGSGIGGLETIYKGSITLDRIRGLEKFPLSLYHHH